MNSSTGRHGGTGPPSVLSQYRALTEGVALVDRSSVARLRIGGSDAVDLLDRLTTNDLRSLTPGMGISTVLTTNKGRVIDLLQIASQGDHLLALVSAAVRERVMEWIEFYTFDEDISVSDITESTFMIGVAGPQAESAVANRFSSDPSGPLPRYGLAAARVNGTEATVLRSDFLGSSEFDFIVPAGDGAALAQALGSSASHAGPQAIEPLRIERGIPAPGSELNEDRNPIEAGLIESISFNKGCYVGQEVVARLHTYDKVQRRLCVLRWTDGEARVDDALIGEGGRVGVLTSAAAHPEGGCVGLAYVKRSFAGDQVVLEPSGCVASIGPATS